MNAFIILPGCKYIIQGSIYIPPCNTEVYIQVCCVSLYNECMPGFIILCLCEYMQDRELYNTLYTYSSGVSTYL